MRKTSVRAGQTAFVNADLDIWSRSRLNRLVTAFGNGVDVLFVGREGARYGAHLELSERLGQARSADTFIRRLAALVVALPPPARKLWDEAEVREFNLGIQAGSRPYSWESRLRPSTVHLAAQLKAGLVVTVYAPEVN